MLAIYKSYKPLHISIIILLSITVIISAFFIYEFQHEKQILNKKNQIKQNINQYVNIVRISNNKNIKRLIICERVASNFLNENKDIYEDKNETLYIDATIENTNQNGKFVVNKFMYKGKPVLNNKAITKKITRITGGYLSIWQKTNEGYLRIVSNLPETVNSITNHVFIHNSSLIVQKIEKGEKYFLRDSKMNNLNLSIYKPLYINGNIKGIIQMTINNDLAADLNKVFSQNIFFSKENVFYLSKNGISIINTKLNNEFYENNIFHKMKLKGETYSSINYKQHIKDKYIGKIIFFKYVPATEGYAGISITEEKMFFDLLETKNNIYAWLFILWLVIIICFVIFFRQFYFFRRNIISKIYGTIDSNIPNKIRFNGKDIKYSFDKLKERINTIEYEITKLTSEKFDIKDEYFSKNTDIGKALISLQKSYYSIIDKQNKINKESYLKKEINSNISNINGLLQSSDDINFLSYQIVKSLVNFLNIEHGGIFILNKDNNNEPYLEMKASYAFEKKRIENKKIHANDGLLGRCVLEKKSIFLTEIPDNYTKIVSGFGEIKPNYLLITPLIFNNKVHGLIEIVSRHKIEQYKIEFMEKIGESIASTFSGIKNTIKAKQLLKQTQEQSKQIETQRIKLQEQIDTHKQQNRKLDKKTTKLNEIISSIKISAYIIEYNINGTIIEINSKMIRALEISYSEIVGKHHKDIVSSDSYELDYKYFWKNLKSNRSIEIALETLMINKKKYSFNQIYIPVKNIRGRIFRVISIGFLIDN